MAVSAIQAAACSTASGRSPTAVATWSASSMPSPRRAPLEVLDGLLAQEDVDGQRVAVLRPGLVPGGDEDVPGPLRREEPLELLGVVGVVEDEQPAGRGHAAPQQVDGLLRGGRHVLAALRAEPYGEFGETGDHVVALFGGDPPDQVVVGHEAVDVFEGHLCLADAAESVQRLRLRQHGRHRHAAAELVAHPLQHHGAAGESGVARRRVPDLRDGAGEARARRSAVGKLDGTVECPQQRGGRVHFVEPEEVHGVAVDVRRGEPHVAHADRQQMVPAAAGVLGRGPLPDLHRPRGLQIRAGQQDHGARGLFGGVRVIGGRIALGRDVARHDPEPGAGEPVLDPVRPHPVLGDVAQEEVGGQGRPAPGEGVPDAEPGILTDRGHRGDLLLGDDGGEPFERGQQGVGEPRLVAEGGQRLLVRVVRPVRDLHRAPVGGGLLAVEPGGEAVELQPGERASGVRLLLLALVDPHRDRVDLDAPAAVPLVDLPGHRGRAVDGLVAEGEAVDEYVGQMDGADVGDVAQAGTAVDEDVVVVGLHVLAQRVEEQAAAEPVVEVVPVEGGDRRRVLAVLLAGGDEVERAAVRELPAEALGGERDGVRLDPGVVRVPVVAAAGVGSYRGPGVLGDQVDHAGGGAERGGVEEGVEEPVQARRLQVPVDGEHPLAVRGENPGRVGQGHRAARTSFVGIEGDDAPVTTGCHPCPPHRERFHASSGRTGWCRARPWARGV